MMTDTDKKVTKKRTPRKAGEWAKPHEGNIALKQLLHRKGYAYREVAALIGVSARHLAFVMAGDRSDNRVRRLIAKLPNRRNNRPHAA